MFAGLPTGLDSSVAWSVSMGQVGAELGSALAAADVDGDGFADLIAGAGAWDDTFADGGAAFLFAGSTAGPASSASWSATGGSVLASFGTVVSAVRDTNGDGFDDVAIGAPYFDAASSNVGRAHLFLGGATGLGSAATLTLQGTASNGRLGACLAGGDVDGDGYADLLVGAVGSRRVNVHWGGVGGPTTIGLTSLTGFGYQGFGSSCSAGDRNRDGFADVLLGAPGGDGTVFGHSGGADGVDTIPDFSFVGTAGAELGQANHLGGDYDGDGAVDVVTCAAASGAGALDVYTGREGASGGEAASLRLRVRQTGGAQGIPGGGRSTTLGFDVVGFVRSSATRSRGKLQVEVEPAGQPFDGAGLLDSGPWTDVGTAGQDLTVSVPGLTLDTAYHVRARILWDPSQAPPVWRGPWVSHRPTDPTGVHVRSTDDADGDGYVGADDCDDSDASVYAGAPETCDAIDSDCDGTLTDEFPDLDLDGDPDCTDPDVDGDGQGPLADGGLDCDDADDSIWDGAPESCDTVDSDCDGSLVDEFADLDGDGEPNCVDEDADGDGQTPTSAGGADCDDLDPSVYDGAEEFCDGTDQDCDGDLVEAFLDTDADDLPDCADEDDDGDGWTDDQDCEPLRPEAFPGAEEACDGIDTDCDGELGLDEVDDDLDGVLRCQELLDGCGGDNDPTVFAGAPEVCDSLDNDCNGEADEGLTVQDWYGDNDLDGFAGNVPHPDNPYCADPGAGWELEQGTDCDDDNAGINPDATELEGNTVDEDCDGTAQGAPGAELVDAPGCACGVVVSAPSADPKTAAWLLLLAALVRRRRAR